MWRDDRAATVAPVLLIGIVVSLAAIAGIMSAIVRDSAEPTAEAMEGDARFVDGDHHIALRQGNLPIEGSFLRITTDGSSQDIPLSWWQAEGTWRAGDWICVAGDGPTCPVPAASAVDVIVWGPDGLVFALGALDGLASETPVVVYTGTRPFFYVDGGGIVIQCSGEAAVHIIGAQITQGIGGAVIPVTVGVTLTGGAPYSNPFGGPVTGGLMQEYAVHEGDVLGLQGRATLGAFDASYTSFDEDEHVLTLVDGDDGPAFLPYGQQIGVGALLAPYVDDDGRITLADDEAIVLFEFNDDLDSPAADFQDLVVLFRFGASSC